MSQEYIHDEVTEFKVREKLFTASRYGFLVRDWHSRIAFMSDSEKFLNRKSKTLLDANGSKLYNIKENVVSLHKRMHVLDGDDKKIMTIHRKNIMSLFKGPIQVSNENAEPMFEIVGSILRRDFQIIEKRTGQEAATISQEWICLQGVLVDKEYYIVKVNPGYSTALMVFLAAAAVENFNEN